MQAHIWTTTACNLRCKYCYEHKKDNTYMTEIIAKKACKFIIQKHISNNDGSRLIIQIHGGEPLLNYNIIKVICNYFNQYFDRDNTKYGIRMTTNLSNVTDSMIDYIATNIEHISISIDGDKYTHDMNRQFDNGSGSFNIVSKNTKKLLKIKPLTWARMTITSDSANRLYENVTYLYDMGFRCISSAIDEFDQNWCDEKYNLLLREIKKCADFLYKKQCDNEYLYIGIVESALKLKKRGVCSAGRQSINIDPTGKIFACTQAVGIDDYCIGDIYTDVDQMKVNQIIKLSECKNIDCEGCANYDYCPGTQCKIINKLMTNDYNKPCMATCFNQNIRLRAADYYRNLQKLSEKDSMYV